MNTSIILSIKSLIAGAFMALMIMPVMAQAFVTLSSDPLFNATNLVPAQVLTGTITLENPTDDTLSGQIQAVNPSGNLVLADAMQVTITEGASVLYKESLSTFLAGSQILLSDVAAGDVTTYTVAVTFDSDAPQSLMGVSLGFDLCVGFAGGIEECGTAFSSGNNGSTQGTRVGSRRASPIERVLGAATVVCPPYLLSTIRPDEVNDRAEVIKLQTFLRDLEGFTTLEITGVYDAATQEATRIFQQRYSEDVLRPWGLPLPTAIVYITTRKMVNEIHCQFTTEFPLTSEQEAEIAWYRAQGTTYRAESNGNGAGTQTGAVAGAATEAEPSQEQGGETSPATEEPKQSAAVIDAGTGFWGTIVNFFRSLWPW
jgi:small nuclear ribonucleoprotein (snRNP)-like protein